MESINASKKYKRKTANMSERCKNIASKLFFYNTLETLLQIFENVEFDCSDPVNIQYFISVCRLKTDAVLMAEVFLNVGININSQNKGGQTAIQVAVEAAAENFKDLIRKNGSIVGCFDTVEFLLRKGANREICDKNGVNAIHEAMLSGVWEAVEVLLTDAEKLPNIKRVGRIQRRRHVITYLWMERKLWNILSTNYSMLLHFLILQNDEEIFEYVVKNTDFDVNGVNRDNYTLLHLVAENGTPRMIRTLLDKGADIDGYGGLDITPLLSAILKRRSKIVLHLLECGASTKLVEKHRWEANTPLHFASFAGYFEIVEMLIKKGADVNALSYYRSPLLVACGVNDKMLGHNFYSSLNAVHSKENFNKNTFFPSHKYNLKVVEFLLDNGADINLQNSSGRTALDHSCKHGNLKIVKLLLSCGANVNKGKVSTLHYAIRGSNPNVVRLILEQGVDVNHRCGYYLGNSCRLKPERTALQWAISLNRRSSCKNIIDILLEYGADINLSDTMKMETPLHLACLSNKSLDEKMYRCKDNACIIKGLLKCSANINAFDIKGWTPFNHAVYNYNLISRFKPFEDTRAYENDLQILIAFVAKLVGCNKFVVKENLDLLKDNSVRPFYEMCEKEIELMKKRIIESFNLSFLDILSKDIDILGGALRNENIMQVLKDSKYKEELKIYAREAEKRIKKVENRRQLIELGSGIINKHLNKNFPFEIVMKIFKHLSQKDLENFAEAFYAMS